MRVGREAPSRLGGVVAQEIDRLAHFRDGIADRAPRLADDEPDQHGKPRLKRIRRPLQRRRALVRRRRAPDRRDRHRFRESGVDGLRRSGGHAPDAVAPVGRIDDLRHITGERSAGHHGLGPPRRGAACDQRHGERGKPLLAREVEPGRIEPPLAIEMARMGDPQMRRADRTEREGLGDGIGDQRLDRHGGIGDAVDEGSVGAVLEQAAHQIGEQRVMRADRRIDAAGPAELLLSDHFLIERLAHAVQALELVLAGIIVRPRHLHDGGERLRIVGRELREDRVRRRQQLPRAGEIGDVGVDLACEDGEILQPRLLGALDLTVPIGALDEPHHQPTTAAPGKIDEIVDDERAALAIGLDDEADAVPAGKVAVEGERFQEVERDLQPIRFLGIDVEADIIAPREERQMLQPRQQLGHDAGALGP